jgi:hypothetical protein
MPRRHVSPLRKPKQAETKLNKAKHRASKVETPKTEKLHLSASANCNFVQKSENRRYWERMKTYAADTPCGLEARSENSFRRSAFSTQLSGASILGTQPPTKVGGSWVGGPWAGYSWADGSWAKAADDTGSQGPIRWLHPYSLAHRATWGSGS